MDWRSTGSFFATLMFLRSIPTILPPEVYEPIRNLMNDLLGPLGLPALLGSLNPITTFVTDQYDSSGYLSNLFSSVEAYLSSKSLASARTVHMCRSRNGTHITYPLSPHESIVETFDGIHLTWSSHSFTKRFDGEGSTDCRSFHLRFLSKHRRRVHEEYLPVILAEADNIHFRNRERMLYTNRTMNATGMLWSSTRFTHPSTLDTITMDPVLDMI